MTRPAIYTKWLEGNVSAEFKGIAVDAGSRQRVSNSETQFYWNTRYKLHPHLWDTVTATGGAATFNSSDRCIDLSCTASTGSTAYIATHNPIFYEPGKSQLIKFTCNLATGGTEFSVIRRYNGSDSAKTIQANFNGNTLPTLDFSKSQLFMIDFLHLGLGDIRFYVLGSDGYELFHTINTANVLTTMWAQEASQPFRAEIVNDGINTYRRIGYYDANNGVFLQVKSNTGSGSFKFYCCSVESEGASRLSDKIGLYTSVTNMPTGKTVNTTERPIIAIRPKATFNSITNRAVLYPIDMDVISTNISFLKFYLRPTLTGASWTSAGSESFSEYDTSATSFSGGYYLWGCPMNNGASKQVINTLVLKGFGLSLDVTGTAADILLITGQANSASRDIYLNLGIKELF